MKLKCVIAYDEEIAGKGLERYCRDISFLHLEAICTSAAEAKAVLEKVSIDLLLLDIQMPVQTGIEFLRSLVAPPMVIITTAFPHFALEGFELEVLDYLVKPFSFERFFKACNKAKEYFELKKGIQSSGSASYFFVKADSRIEKIEINEILFVEALENYVCIYTQKRKYMTLVPLKSVEQTLSGQQFIKVQKSYLVAKDKIDSFEGNTIHIGEHLIPISRKWKNEVIGKIVSDKLLKR